MIPSDHVLRSFLVRQFEEGQRLAADSDIVTLLPTPEYPPQRYVAEFCCAGLAQENGEIVIRNRWAFGIFFPDDYLRRPLDVATLLTYLGAAARPFHPQIAAPFICMHLAPGATLVEIVTGLFELLTFNVYSTADDGLNPIAAQWVRRQNPARFPLECRPLKRRPLPPQTRIASTPKPA